MVIITPISKNFVKSINSDEIQILRKINFGKNTYSFYHFFAKVFYVQKIQHLSVKATFFSKRGYKVLCWFHGIFWIWSWSCFIVLLYTQCGNCKNTLSPYFRKNFVKVTFLLKKLLTIWFDFDRIVFSMRENFTFFTLCYTLWSKIRVFPHCELDFT